MHLFNTLKNTSLISRNNEHHLMYLLGQVSACSTKKRKNVHRGATEIWIMCTGRNSEYAFK